MSKKFLVPVIVILLVIIIILAIVAINAISGNNGQANSEASNANVGSQTSENPVEPSAEKSEVAKAKESGEIFDDTTEIKDDLGNVVKIPGEFHIASDSGTKVEEGIVIEDEIGNQFVWIPVGEYNVTEEIERITESVEQDGKLTNNLARRTFTESGTTEVNGDDAIEGEYSNEYNEYQFYGEGSTQDKNGNSIPTVAQNQIGAFKTSSINNHGFYIGRYEAGTEEERTSLDDTLTVPLVQANKNAYVNISRDNAKKQSEAMYKDNDYVTSELISGYAWNTALNFMCQTNNEGYMLATTTDKSYGNIGTTKKELTGSYKENGVESDKHSNIYDFLGNCWEWTTEYSSLKISPCVSMGGSYYYGDQYAAYRNYGSGNGNSVGSFRIQLYIK